MFKLPSFLKDAVHLFYPHICTGCGSDLLKDHALLCIHCNDELPHTHFADYENNPIESIFNGRITISAAHSQYYFSKGQLIQQLIHELKYKGNKKIGAYLGEKMGETLLQSTRFKNIDAIIPLPMFAEKEFKRGYNQAAVIADGIANAMNIPCYDDIVIRHYSTETQTKKHRAERWKNVEGSFAIKNQSKIIGKNIMLVDDVITTGATLEACGTLILETPNTQLSIVSLAIANT